MLRKKACFQFIRIPVYQCCETVEISQNVLKTQRQISDFFSIWCVSLIEVTMQNFRLPFLIETGLKRFFRYCDKLRR